MLTQVVMAGREYSDFQLGAVLRKRLQKYACRVSGLFLSVQACLFRSMQAGSASQDNADDASEETQPTPAAEQAVTSTKPVNILVVEDEGIVALHIKMTLTRMGHRVIATVDSGQDAIIVAFEQRPDLILMDIRLKGELDGIEAARTIQQRYAVPVIYLTGQLDESTVKRAQTTNPIGYLAKPFIVSEIAALIQRSFEKSGR
jgi:CheY-like chemotaxis protein